jgi:predicted kinase
MVDERRDALPAKLFVMVGLPGSGKTTRAREIEDSSGALRLSPDEWMIPLFGAYEAEGARDVLEGRLLSLAARALRLGVDVVLDFGVWARVERAALRHLARSVGATCELVYLPLDPQEQYGRIASRLAAETEPALPIPEEELRRAAELFEAPDEHELGTSAIEPPPPGFATWDEWIVKRWPSFSRG